MATLKDIDTEIAVIGAGPCGAALAHRLAVAGRAVLLIERGEWMEPGSIDRSAPDYDLQRRSAFNANPNIRCGPADDPVDDSQSPIKPMIGNSVGGGSLWWSAHVPRFRPEDFHSRTLDGVGEDWPISYANLSPYYTQVEDLWGVASVLGDPSGMPDRSASVKPLPSIGAHGHRITAALDRMGWHWWPVDLVVGKETIRETDLCTHTGPCDIGCPARYRSGADRIVAEAMEYGATIMTTTRVQRLEIGMGDRVTAAVCKKENSVFRVKAKTFVLAAGGMGTPRLLLLSACKRFPNGLANSSGLVGRMLMLHPYARVDGLFPDAVGSLAPHETAGIVSLEFLPTCSESRAKRGVKLQLVAGPSAVALARGSGTGQAFPWGSEHHAAFRNRFDRICGFTVCAEDLPDPENRITLSTNLVDKDGQPAAKWIYKVSQNSRRLLDHGMDRATEILIEAGAKQTFRTPLRDQAGFHIAGTTRMGTDPQHSVTDPTGRCHDLENLFVADASTFVTSSCLNPTSTAQALALRLADNILGTPTLRE